MQKRKFDELISHFNRKVSDMSIDQKYKMELLGMISAIGFAHEKELSTNLAEVGTDCISRQATISAICNACGKIDCDKMDKCEKLQLPPASSSEIPNSSDTISRQAAIEAADAIIARDTSGNNTVVNAMIAWREYIKHLQHAHPKRGKWILDGHHVRCDQCGTHMCNTDREGDPIPRFFCPNCGAEMEVTT